MSDYIKEGYTRISKIASSFAPYHNIPTHVLETAAKRGGAVHKLILHTMACLPLKEADWMYKDEPLQGYFDSYEQFYEPYKDAEVIMQEKRIDDPGLMITGEPDLLIKHQGKMLLMDWKCTIRTGKHWQIQAEGYCNLLSTHSKRIDKIIFVRLDKSSKYPEVIEYKPEWRLFMKAYELYKMFFENHECNLESE